MKYLLLLLLLVPSISHSFVEFNYNRLANLCTGFVALTIYSDGEIPDTSFLVMPSGAPLTSHVTGTADSIIWSSLIFPVPGQVQTPYGKDCYFHSCYIDNNSANLKMSCVDPQISDGPFEVWSNGLNLDLTVEIGEYN